MNLIDTNVLLYALDALAPQHTPSAAVLRAAAAGRLPAVLVPQVLLELFAAVTNPRRVLHPLPIADAWREVSALRATLPVLDVPAGALTQLDHLVAARQPAGAEIYDLFLVAQMRVHGLSTICTYNTADFASVPGVDAVTPEGLLARLRLP